MRTGSGARVTPPFDFDRGLGDLFVLRDAGPTSDEPAVAGSEYAGAPRHAAFALVVGHAPCGPSPSRSPAAALQAASPRSSWRSAPPSAKRATKPADKTDNAVCGHARRAAQTLAATGPIIAHAVQSGQITIFAARYDLASGRSDLLPPSRAWRSVSQGKRPRVSRPASPWPRGPIAGCRPEPGALPRTRRSRKAGSPPTGPAPTFTRR